LYLTLLLARLDGQNALVTGVGPSVRRPFCGLISKTKQDRPIVTNTI